MAGYILKPPVQIYQDTMMHCWAAAGASWLRTTHIGNASRDQLVRQYRDYCDDQGYLVEDTDSTDMSVVKAGGLKEVFRLIGVYLIRIPRSDFTFELANKIIRKKGHFLLVGTTWWVDETYAGHTRVVYGVGFPNDNWFSDFNPHADDDIPSGYENLAFSDFNQGDGNLYLGWARWAGPL